ncbi:HAMP domain-containing protein [Azoarcus indigens]|nr:HAMP domain-containing protein [Azoarcus indigens]
MAGQLIGVLLTGIIAAHLIALPFSGLGSGVVHPLALRQILERYAAAYRAVQSCSGCDQEALLAALGAHDIHFRLATVPTLAVPEMDEDEAELADSLARLLRAGDGVPVAVHMQEESPEDSPLTRRTGAVARATSLTVEAPLADGRVLAAKLWPVVRTTWWRPLLFSVPVSILPVLLVVFLFARRILRPVRALEQAAEHISRGEQVEALPVRGPKELREVTSAFNTMQERLSRFVADRTRMIAAISHDFRTPITSLRLRVEMVDDPGLRGAMTRTLDEMRAMVEETLHFARDDSVRETTVEVDLSELVARAGSERAALGHDVCWEVPASLPYRCRAVALARAVGNLADNAVRYGKRARLRLEPPASGALRILVDDDGPGIPDEWLDKAFEPFARPDRGRNREAGGVGLGLAIARSCIEAHGGRVWLENRPEGGARAIILLPASAAT